MPIEPFDFTYSLSSQSEQNETLNALGKNRVKEYEPKSYFFTESTLTAQADSQGAYGPVDENKFNITTQFHLADKKAYAVTSGQVLIVPQTGIGNESKINVFIKPLKHVDVGVPIKYYVYRGLKKELFVDSNNNIVAKNTSNTPFMAKVWTDLINHNKLTEPLPQIPASLFGYSTTETNTNSLDAKFFNTYDSTTTDENKVYNLAILEAGQYFGDFKDDKGGFEIVLNDGFYYQEKSDTGFQFDLSYARSERMVLDIADIVDKPNISEKMYRENVQKFLDPAAFYGAHITEKEKGEIQFVDNTTKHSNRVDIFNNVINKFYNKYKCYIYLQGNRGRSFNFDEALGTEPLKIGVSEVITPSPYQTNGWPIIINEYEQTHTDDENDTSKIQNNLSFQLKFKTVNKNVTLYNAYGNCSNDTIEGNFLSSKAFIDEANIASQDYTNEVNYKLINNYNLDGSSLVTKNIATFIYINHEEKEVEYFNDFFGPVKIDHLIKVNDQFLQKNIRKSASEKRKTKNRYIDGQSSISNLNYTSIPYVNPQNQSSTDDLFKIYILKKFDSEGNLDPHLKPTSSVDIKYSTIKTNDDYGIFEYGSKDYKVWKGQVNDDDNTPFKTLQLINLETEGNVTNFTQLGLMNDDYKKVIFNSLTSDTTNHIATSSANIYFHLDDTNITQTSLFKKYKLGVKVETFDLFWGVNYQIVYPSLENEVYVYTVDGYYFFTKEFSEKFNFVEEFAQAVVNFKPKNNTVEAFGFDWMRLSKGTEMGYEESILNGYQEPEWVWNGIIPVKNYGYASIDEAFQGLKREYIRIATKQNNLYYVPYLNIYPATTSTTLIDPPYGANLTATIDIYENLTKLELDYDTNLFEISANLPTNLNIGTKDFDIQIFCNEELKTDKYIKIIASSQQQGELTKVKLAGIIKVCKNAIENRERIKIVLIEATTDIEGDGINEVAKFTSTEILNLKYILYQAQIFADIERGPKLNLITDEKFKTTGEYISDIGEIYEIFPAVPGQEYDEKQDYLKDKIDEKYKTYFRVYAFELASKEAAGNVQTIGKHSACIYSNRSDTTLAHEVCHGLGLFHSHADGVIKDSNQKYTYPYAGTGSTAFDRQRATDNIMSYNHDIRKSLWQWQWKIMHNNIKNYSNEE